METSPIREAKRLWLEAVVKDLGGNQRQIAARLEIPYANFNGMVRGHRAVSDDTVDLIHQRLGVALPLSGYPFTTAEPSPKYGGLPLAVTVDRDGEENIVCVEGTAKAGYTNGLGDPTYLQTLPAYRLPYLGMGTFRDFSVEGFSMYNPETGQIMQGSHVICRSIDFNALRSSRVHVVVTANDVLVKRIYPEDGHLRLRSDNPDKLAFPDIVLPNEEVRELWYVERLVSASIPPRSSTDEMEEMRRQIEMLQQAVQGLAGRTIPGQ